MPQRTLVTFKPIRVPLGRTAGDKDIYDALMKEVESFGRDLKKDFEATTESWSKKPTFRIALSTAGNKVSYRIYTNSLIYYMLSKGIKRHKIYPKGHRAMRLKGVKRTRSLTLTSWNTVGLIKVPTTTTRAYQTQAYAKEIRHPGVKKRDYPAVIMRKRKPTFSPRMHAAITKAITAKRHR